MFFLYLLLSLIISVNIYSTELNSIIVEDTSIQDEETVKKIKKEDNKSASEAIEDTTTTFIRKSGGVGSSLDFYIDGSSSSQVSLSIEGFDYTTPSLAKFNPTSLYFGGFDNISINKDNSFSQDNLTSHSANIDFSISSKNYISSVLGSFGAYGLTSNRKIDLAFLDGSSLNIGGVFLSSENDFSYVDIHKNKRRRDNEFYRGGDFYIKFKSDNIKFINYLIVNKKGTPGSNQFERKEANTSNFQNLIGISFNKEFEDFNLKLKFSENYKNYNYTDNKPPIFGLKRIEYNLESNTISSNIGLDLELGDYGFFDAKLVNLTYFANSENVGSKKNVPTIHESNTFISIKNDYYLLDESLILNLSARYYMDSMYQYSLSGLYYINNHLMIKLLTKKGLRIPYLEEKYWESSSVKGNPDLFAETIYKNLFSLHFKYSIFNIKTEFFYSKLKDNIIFTPISFGLVKAINTDKAIAKGINIINDFNFKYLKINNILSYTKTTYERTKKDLPQTPRFQEKLNLKLVYNVYSLDFNYSYTSKYYNNVFNTDIIPKKQLISLSLNYIFNKKTKSNIKFKINNLTNELEYYDSLHIPLPGRSYFFYLNLYFL